MIDRRGRRGPQRAQRTTEKKLINSALPPFSATSAVLCDLCVKVVPAVPEVPLFPQFWV